MSADAKLKAYIDRVLRLKEEQDTLGDDIREVYAEAKAEGYDKTVMGKLVAHLRKVQKAGEGAVSEQEMVFDTYLQAYHRASGTVVATHTHEEDYDQETGEVLDGEANAKLIATVATGMQTEIGRKALVTALDIMIEREEADDRRSDNGLNIQTKHEDITASPETAEETPKQVYGDSVEDATAPPSQPVDIPACGDQGHKIDGSDDLCPAELLSQSDDDAFAEVKGRARLANADGVETSSSDRPSDQPSKDQSNEVAISSALRAGLADPTSNTGEGAAKTALPAVGIVIESVPPAPMKRPDFATCFPELSNAAYAHLHDEIQASGICAPIIRHGEVILDGWDRYNISRELGFNYPVQPYSGTDVLLDVIEWQRSARKFTPAQEKKIAADLAKEFPRRADDIFAAFGLAEALEAAQ